MNADLADRQKKQDEQFKSRTDLWRAQKLEEQKLQAGQGKAIAEGQKAQGEASDVQRFGSPEAAKTFRTEIVKSKADALAARESLIAANDLQKAINGGMITGTGANQKLDYQKFLKAWNLSDKNDQVTNTEEYKARVVTFMGPMRKLLLSGSTSDPDREFLLNASAGNITLEPESMKRIVAGMSRMAGNVLDRHNADVGTFFKEGEKEHKLYSVAAPAGDKSAISPEEMATRDNQALDWASKPENARNPMAIDIARANPNDPRSKRILGIR